MLLEIVSAVIFLTSHTLPVLLLARLVSGAGVGLITATATAHIVELGERHRPGSQVRSGVVASVANIGGIAVGPLVSGLLAEYVRSPLVVPYAVFLVLLVLAAVVVAFVPETVVRPAVRPAYRPQRIRVPAAARSQYFAAAGAGFAAFAVLGLFTSLAPRFVAVTMHHPSHALAGLVAFLVFGSAAAAQVLAVRLSLRAQMTAAFVVMPVGLVVLAAGVFSATLWLFVGGGVLAGFGVGLLFKVAFAVGGSLAPADARGEALSGLFLASYVGLTVPVIGLGAATQQVSDETAFGGFVVGVLVVLALVARRLFASVRV